MKCTSCGKETFSGQMCLKCEKISADVMIDMACNLAGEV